MASTKSNVCVMCGDPKPTRQGKTCSAVCLRALRSKYVRDRAQRIVSSNPDAFPCEICSTLLLSMSSAHLKRHGIRTLNEYKVRYPNSPTMTQQVRKTRGKSSTARANYLTYSGKEPDDVLNEFLTGTLLGDGNIGRAHGINGLARYAEGGNNQQYMAWKYEFLRQYFHTTFKEKLSSPHTKTGRRYRGWWLRTSVHPYLTKLLSLWYPNGTKIVPLYEVIKNISPFSLSIWYCDDGNKKGHIYTQGFTFDEVGALRVILLNKFKLHTRVLVKDNKPIMYIPASSRKRFGELVSPLPGMAYKFEGLSL